MPVVLNLIQHQPHFAGEMLLGNAGFSILTAVWLWKRRDIGLQMATWYNLGWVVSSSVVLFWTMFVATKPFPWLTVAAMTAFVVFGALILLARSEIGCEPRQS
ncbi:MAG: hypothetical protein ACREI9_10670 [Nitrospiraceae bacterium]